MSESRCLTAIAIAFSFALCCNADNSVPLLSINPATDIGSSSPSGIQGFDESNSNGTVGWSFYVKAPITVYAVGWYDQNADGLFHSHQIGLWKDLSGQTSDPYVQFSQTDPRTLTNAQQLLGTFSPFLPEGVTVPAGSAAELSGPWRKVSLPAGPIVLSPGGYVLGGTDSTDSPDIVRYGLDRSNPFFPRYIPADPRIEIGAPGFSSATGFQAPANFFLVDGVELGPMLFVDPVPEPSTIAQIVVAVGFIFGRRARILS